MLELMQEAPDFTLKNQDREIRTLSDYREQFVVLYFYPKDHTPGCTEQACAYRDVMEDFDKENVKVFGISKDGAGTHKNFRKNNHLNFELLSDESREVIKAYGVYKEKKMYGKTVGGTIRSTFVINPEGKLIKVFEEVDPALDAELVLDYIRSIAKA